MNGKSASHHDRLKRFAIRIAPLIVAVALAAIFLAMSWSAVRTKSPTKDEPWEFSAAWAHVFLHDDRVCCQDPPLWYYVMMLPMSRDSLRTIPRPSWDATLEEYGQINHWVDDTFYRTPGNDADAIILRARGAMVFVGAAVVLLATLLAWRLGGAAAGCLAGVFLAFDPTLLGQSPLLKNDVMLELLWLGLAATTLAVLRKLTAVRGLVLILLIALSPTIKMSGTLAAPISIAALASAAIVRRDWPTSRRSLQTRRSKLLVVGVICLLSIIASWLAIWTLYGFRFSPTPQSDRLFNEAEFLHMTAERSITAAQGWPASEKKIALWRPDAVTRGVMFAVRHRLLPDAFCMGFLHTRAWAFARQSYLLGNVRATGWWYYFPLTLLFKAPTATLAATIAAALGAWRFRWPRLRSRIALSPIVRAMNIELFIAIVFAGGFLAATMTSNLNLGVRHVMPVGPIIVIAISVVLSRVLQRWRASLRMAAVAGFIGLMLAESISARPNYIAFFSWPCGGARGGIHLLGDSNLDWGQDLSALKIWRAAHPDRLLYASYFGPTDPRSAGLDCVDLPGDADLARVPADAVIAVSATHLQGLFLSPQQNVQLESLRRDEPTAILNGTIYLYDLRKNPLQSGK